jgi:hypothetical protein
MNLSDIQRRTDRVGTRIGQPEKEVVILSIDDGEPGDPISWTNEVCAVRDATGRQIIMRHPIREQEGEFHA